MSNNTAVSLDSTRIETAGADARGIWTYGTAASVNNTLSLGNGSRIDTQDAVGLLVSGGSHRITLDRADITARRDGSTDDGMLLYARSIDVTSGRQTGHHASASKPAPGHGSRTAPRSAPSGRNGRVNSLALRRSVSLHLGHAQERRHRPSRRQVPARSRP